MAGKSAIQKLIEQYEAEIAEHQRAIASKKDFVVAMKATLTARAKLKPRTARLTVATGETRGAGPLITGSLAKE